MQPTPIRGIPSFNIMLKPRGPICNLDCSYCYYLAKEALYPGSGFHMTDEVLEAFTEQYIASQFGPEVVFGWQGGEPTLLGLDFFKRAVALQEKYARPGQRILNTFQTNGTRLDKAWGSFLAQHGFLVGLSIDGPAPLHDAFRVDKGGKPSFEGVMRGLGHLQEAGVEYNILTTVHTANAPHPLEVYRFLRDEVQAEFVQFIPIVEREGDGITPESVSGEAYGEFLIRIFDEWVQRDVGKVFVQIFDVALAAWATDNPGLCIFQPTCGLALALEHNGDLYACDHFVEAEHLLGNVMETPLPALVGSDQQRVFGAAKRTSLPGQCRRCEVRFACQGGCPKNRLGTTGDGEEGLNHLCEGYFAFFTHIRPAMEWMTRALEEERAPAGIMDAEEFP